MMDNSEGSFEKEKERKYGQMEPSMMVSGRRTMLGVMASLLIKMEIRMRDNGLTARHVVTGNF